MPRAVRVGVGLATVCAVMVVTGWGCRMIDPTWAADAKSSPSKTSRVFAAPPSEVGPALMLACDELAIRIDEFQVRDSEQGYIVDIETTREDQRRPGGAFKNSEILSGGSRFSDGLVGPDLLDGQVRRADGRTLQFNSIEAIFRGKTPDNRQVVVTTKRQAGSTVVNISLGNFGDPALSRTLFSDIEKHLNAKPEPRATPQ
jgi:hypothetical protein